MTCRFHVDTTICIRNTLGYAISESQYRDRNQIEEMAVLTTNGLPRLNCLLAASRNIKASYATARKKRTSRSNTAAEVPELDAIVRQFMKQVHPDRLIKHPDHRKHNENAVQVRNGAPTW